VDRIVAVINDNIITLSELNAAAALAAGGAPRGGGAAMTEGAGAKMLEGLVEQRLVKQAADKAGIDVSEREIDNAVEDIRRQNSGMTEEALAAAISRSGLTFKEYRDQLKEQIRQVKFLNREFRSKVSVQDEDIEEHYRLHADEFTAPAAYRINLIFIPSGDASVMEKKLKAVNEGIEAGVAFGDLARQYSEGPSAAQGGDMGYLSSGEMDRAVEEAASRLEPGGISRPVPAGGGVNIIQLVDSKPSGPRPLAEVRGSIQEGLFKKILDERFGFWLDEAKKAAHIERRM
jgi:peptidyl-prolyl cis-trans isomerase SurA